MKRIIILALVVVSMIGCKKDKPPIGDYIGTFDGTYTYQNTTYQKYRSHRIVITESNKDEVIFECGGNEYVLAKNKDAITGTFETDKYVGTGHNESDGPITINGSWKKGSGTYIISGTFESTYSFLNSVDSTQQTFPVKGTFEIKSEF